MWAYIYTRPLLQLNHFHWEHPQQLLLHSMLEEIHAKILTYKRERDGFLRTPTCLKNNALLSSDRIKFAQNFASKSEFGKKKASQEPRQVNECLVDHTNEDAVSACCSPTCLCQCQLQSMPCVPPRSFQPGAKQGGWCNMHRAKLGVSSSRGHSKLRKGDFHSVSLDRNQMQQHEDKVESEFPLFT